MTLRELQQQFLNNLLHPEQYEMASYVNAITCLSEEDCMTIYRNGMLGIWIRTLKEIYPVCLRLVEEEFFSAMAEIYVKKNPSHSSDLNCYGESFATFISTFPPAQPLPYLPDVARLEWLWHRAFHGENASVLDREALAGLSVEQQEKIIFHLPANAELLHSPYPIDRIWQTNQLDFQGDDIVRLDTGAVYLMIWQKDLAVRIESISAEEWEFLNALRTELPFAKICEDLDAKGIDVIRLLPQFAERGWLGSFHLAEG